MKGVVALQLNDDDSILVQAQVPIDSERARVQHYAYDWDDLAAALAKAGAQLADIRAKFVEPTPKSNLTL